MFNDIEHPAMNPDTFAKLDYSPQFALFSNTRRIMQNIVEHEGDNNRRTADRASESIQARPKRSVA